MSLLILRFLCAAKSAIEKLRVAKSPKIFLADGNFLYSRHEIYVVFMSQFFIFDQHFLKTSFCLLSLTIKLNFNILKVVYSLIAFDVTAESLLGIGPHYYAKLNLYFSIVLAPTWPSYHVSAIEESGFGIYQ